MEPPEMQLLPSNILRVFEILFKKYFEKFAESAVIEFILSKLLRLTHLQPMFYAISVISSVLQQLTLILT